ncbi:MAG: C25 family cysteine peptidase, partial [Fidelibacterota bacterium]
IPQLIDGSYLLEAGAPDLQKLTTSLIIPNLDEMEVEVVSSEYREYSKVLVAPSKGNLTRDIDPSSIPYEFGDVYSTDSFYPGTIAELGTPYIIRDFRGQTVRLFPLQYNPVSQTLRVYTQVVVRVFSTGSNGENPLYTEELTHMNNEFKNLYQHHFLNYENIMNTRYDVLGEEGNMLVICYSAFMDAMLPFIDWKNMRGLRTELVDIADVGSTSSAIGQFVEDYYFENGLAYLLLVGDISQIPSPMVGGAASDPSYGFIVGSDYYSDVMVGRFSAENLDHVITQVERMITYERYPLDGADWYHKGTGLGSSQGSGVGDEGEADWEHEDNIRAKLLDYTYTEVDQFYDPGATSAQVTSAVNEGRSVMNYTGHGSQNSWSTSGFSSSNVNNLTNDNKLPFIWSVACVNGEFYNGTCFAENWLRATNNGVPTGAIGAFMSTINQSWAPPMDGQDEFNDILVELYDNNIKRSYGGLSANGCMHMNDTYGSQGDNETTYWTLFGDPSLLIRTDTPMNITVNHDPVMVIGSTECPVSVPGISEGTAALSYQGELLGVTSLDATGNGTIILDEPILTPMEIDLVVTGFNTMTYEGTILVIVPEGPYVVMDDYVISSDSNGNGDIDYGETIEMFVYAENVGVDQAENVVGTASCDDPYISIVDADLSFGTIGAGENVMSEDTFSFDISNETPDGYTAVFNLELTNGTDSWTSNFSITVNAYCVAGDVQVDWDINVLDIIRVVNIIINVGAPPTEDEICAADIDGNNAINILDVINIINFIVGSDGYRLETDPIEFQMQGNDLILKSKGGVAGLQIEVDSPEVELTEIPGFTTSYNIVEGRTIILFYSLSAETIPEGTIELMTGSTGFDIISTIAVDRNGDEIETHINEIPSAYSLAQNFPNPFNPTTNIQFSLPIAGEITLKVYDILGQEVASLVDGSMGAGIHTVVWNGKNMNNVQVPSGIYFYNLETEKITLSHKMILMK